MSSCPSTLDLPPLVCQITATLNQMRSNAEAGWFTDHEYSDTHHASPPPGSLPLGSRQLTWVLLLFSDHQTLFVIGTSSTILQDPVFCRKQFG